MQRTILTSLLLLFTLLANAQEQEYVYRKVTSQDQIVDGGVYVLARDHEFFYYITEFMTDKFSTKPHNRVNEFWVEDACELTIEDGGNNTYFLKFNDNRYLIYYNGLKASIDKTYAEDNKWKISIDETEDHQATIKASIHQTDVRMKFHSNGNYIGYYKSSTSDYYPVILYRKYPVTPPTTTEQVSVGTSGYATLCSNKDLDFTGSNIHAYVGKLTSNVLTLQEVNKVKANEGVILYTEGSSVTANVNSVTMTSEENEAFPQNDLRGVSAEAGVTVDDNGMYYALRDNGNDVGFYPISTNVVIPKGKAYLHIPGTSETHAKISFGFLTPTSITAPRQIRDGKTYNLSGQTVDSNYRGITITNGRKSLRK